MKGFVALAVPALDLNVPAADMVGPMVAATVLGTAGAVLVLVMVFSALSSSLDSLLAATSILVVEDIYRRHLRPDASAESLRRVTALVIVGLGIVTWLLCAPRIATLAELLYFTGAFVASTIWPSGTPPPEPVSRATAPGFTPVTRLNVDSGGSESQRASFAAAPSRRRRRGSG